MIIKKGKVKIAFQDTTENGLMGISLTPVTNEALYKTQTKEDPNVLHQKLGHPCKEITEITAKHLGIKLNGKPNKCGECLLGKVKKKDLEESNQNKSTVNEEKVDYPDNNHHNNYRSLNIKTMNLVESRDVKRSGEIFGECEEAIKQELTKMNKRNELEKEFL
jgi:hypothetical protein